MATSLAEQLKKLAIPQTNILTDSKKRASLLFDPSEAAKLTRDDVFEIGKDGLRELIEVHEYFKEFQDNLFDPEKRHIQRVVESKEANKKLDKLISKFLIRLSPHLLLKSSQKALEWLIYRYRINEVNVKELFALILPYHETNVFVKLLQLIDLNALVFKDWSWLKTFQKKGLHVPRAVLLNHAISDSSFLRFICDTTVSALKVHKKTETEWKLRTQLAFYTSTLVGILARDATDDHLLTVLLPSLVAGLQSDCLDYKAAACMSVAQLAATKQLSSNLASKLLDIIVKDNTKDLRKSRVFVVMTMYQKQKPAPPFPRSLLAKWDWSVAVLRELAQSGVLVGPLVEAMVDACLLEITESGPLKVETQVLCWNLADQVQCDGISGASIFRLMIAHYEKLKSVQKKRKSPDDENDSSAIDWLKVLIETTCAKYADVFDKLQGDGELKRLRSQWLKEDQDEVVDIAVSALVRKCLAGNHSSAWPQLKVALLKQIDDGKIFKTWCKASPASEPLTLLLCLDRIFGSVQNKTSSRLTLKKISESSYGTKTPHFSQLNIMLRDRSDLDLNSTIEDYFLNTWVGPACAEGRPDVSAWTSALKELKTCGKVSWTSRMWPLALKMLVALAPGNATGAATQDILDTLRLIKALKGKHQVNVLSAIIDKFANEPIELPEWVDLSQMDLRVHLRLKVMEFALSGLHDNARCHDDFVALITRFFQACFPDGRSVVRFLSAVCGGVPVHPLQSEPPVSLLLQIHALHWSWTQLSSESEPVFNAFKPELVQLTCHILLALGCESLAVRKAAFKVLQATVAMIGAHQEDELPFTTLLTHLLQRADEITADADQVNVALYCLLSPDASVRKTLGAKLASTMATDREKLLGVLISPDVPLYIATKLSLLLEAVNSVDIIKELCPLGTRALQPSAELHLTNKVMAGFWQRLNETTACVLEDPVVWSLAQASLRQHKGDALSPAVVFLKVITKDVYAALPTERQITLLELLVSTRAETESPSVTSAVATSCRKITMDGAVVLQLLTKMIKALPKELNIAPSTIQEAEYWRHGLALLELIQNKKKLRESRVLIAPLFAVLKFCLDQEEQTAFEYAKQLVLGCLLDLSERLVGENASVEPALLDVELIVQCLRASSNPQTHHHALLLLSCLGSIIPNQVMHNIMAIFTFMGSSVARLDDEHSVQVVAKVVDTIIPVLITSLNTESPERDTVIAEVLRIFVWTLRDIPHHRRRPLFNRLITTLNPDRSLWIFLVLICENYVVGSRGGDKNAEGSMPPNLQLGMELGLSFGSLVVLNTVRKLIHYLVEIPLDIMNPRPDDMAMDEDRGSSDGLFDIRKHTPKQLRHYIYTLITFLNTLLSDNNLIIQVRELEGTEADSLEEMFKQTMAALLLYVPKCSAQHDRHQTKFWKAMVTHGYDVLDRLVALVSSDTLVLVITRLLDQGPEIIRRKAVDLLNVHIQNHRGAFTAEEKTSLLNLIAPLLTVACSRPSGATEGDLIQQTALLSLRLLAKVLAGDDPQPFMQVLIEVTKLCKGKGHLLASAVLTVADLVAHLKARSVSELPKFLPAMLKVFSKYTSAESTDIVLMSLAAALYRIVEVLAQFLSPYVDKILTSVSRLSVKWPETADLNRKLLQIRQKLSSSVPHRVLIPATGRCYTELVKDGSFNAIGPLLSTLADSFNVAPDVSKLLPDLTPFFFTVLQLRSDVVDGTLNVSDDDVAMVEGFAIDALLPLVLKLSELSFKPLYYQLFHWASEHPHRPITFYRLSSRLADGLKGLFVLFAGHILHNAANLLEATNVSKTPTPHFGPGPAAEAKAILLLENIISTLRTVFQFDSSTFLSKDKFQVLLHPLVDQLENTLGGPESLEERTTRLLTPCIAQMTLATDDTQWKALNYQLLMKTRSPSPMVRIAALNTVVGVAAKLGEDYLTLLPETIGSLAELLEDEDERVEVAMKEALRKMEDVLGQPISDYFQ